MTKFLEGGLQTDQPRTYDGGLGFRIESSNDRRELVNFQRKAE